MAERKELVLTSTVRNVLLGGDEELATTSPLLQRFLETPIKAADLAVSLTPDPRRDSGDEDDEDEGKEEKTASERELEHPITPEEADLLALSAPTTLGRDAIRSIAKMLEQQMSLLDGVFMERLTRQRAGDAPWLTHASPEVHQTEGLSEPTIAYHEAPTPMDDDVPPPLEEIVDGSPLMRGFWHTWTPPSERDPQVAPPPPPPAPALIPQRGPLPPTIESKDDPMDLCDVD
jgi:hypothetical protein